MMYLIPLWGHLSSVAINPCPSLLLVSASLCMTVSYLTSYQFPVLVFIAVIAGYSFQTM